MDNLQQVAREWSDGFLSAMDMNCWEFSQPRCAGCGKHATFTDHEEDFTETHGLDCGPYETWTERWMTCDLCGAETDERELAAMNREAEVVTQ